MQVTCYKMFFATRTLWLVSSAQVGNLVPEVAATSSALREQVHRKVAKLQKKVFPLQSKRKMKTLRCQLFPASWIKKNKRIRKHKQQKETRWMPVKFQNRNPKKQNQKQSGRPHSGPDPQTPRPRPEALQVLAIPFSTKVRVQQAEKTGGVEEEGREEAEEKRGKGKTCSNLLDISSFAYCGNFICLARFLVFIFLYRIYILPICNLYFISMLQHFPAIQHNISIVINIFHILLFLGFHVNDSRKLRNDLPRPLSIRLDF